MCRDMRPRMALSMAVAAVEERLATTFGGVDELEDQLFRQGAGAEHMAGLEKIEAEGDAPSEAVAPPVARAEVLSVLMQLSRGRCETAPSPAWFTAVRLLDELCQDGLATAGLNPRQLLLTGIALAGMALSFHDQEIVSEDFWVRLPDGVKAELMQGQLISYQRRMLDNLQASNKLRWQQPTVETWAVLFCKRFLLLKGKAQAPWVWSLYQDSLSLAAGVLVHDRTAGLPARRIASATVLMACVRSGLLTALPRPEQLDSSVEPPLVELCWVLGLHDTGRLLTVCSDASRLARP
eukprot:TRINITY_DN20205_c0_g1_i2.p1 TRINITY_DN20205_c0_g1~~TRINITY_DN20205_c0_g1_i2.p1  ORF type:complete len:294 (-),score=65.61 TRINITY_DN20205_c0_g1_i2:72-953(-)